MSADPSAPSPSLPSRRWFLRFAIAAGALVALIAIAWLAVPPIVRGQLESRLTEALGRKTTVEAVEFNPFTLRLTLRKLAIADPGGAAPLFAVDELVADLSSASLWHRAPVLDALRLVHPAVSLARDRDGRYSVQDLIDNALAGVRPARRRGFSLNNIEIDGGSIAFDDGTTGRKHRVEKLAIGVPFLSSLPYQTDIRVTPRLEGAFNGSHFALGRDDRAVRRATRGRDRHRPRRAAAQVLRRIPAGEAAHRTRRRDADDAPQGGFRRRQVGRSASSKCAATHASTDSRLRAATARRSPPPIVSRSRSTGSTCSTATRASHRSPSMRPPST